MENNVETEEMSSQKFLSFLKRLYKNLVWMIIVFVVIFGCGIGYGLITNKTTYVAKHNLILKIDFNLSSTTSQSTILNDYTLAQRTLPTIAKTIKTPLVIETARSYHNDDGIVSNNINVNYNSESLLFTICYSDEDIETASYRLEDVIRATEEVIVSHQTTTFTDIEFVKTQYAPKIGASNNLAKIIVISLILGLGITVLIFALMVVFDNKAKDKEVIKELTGVDTLAIIIK